MEAYLLDSNIIIGSLEKGIQLDEKIKSSRSLAISALTYYEVKYGILKASKKNNLDEYLDDLRIDVLPIGIDDVDISLTIALQLEKIGLKIPLPDIFIAGTAIANEYTLVTRDLNHFNRIKGLQLYQF